MEKYKLGIHKIFLILYKNQIIIYINIYTCDIKTRAEFLF